MADPSGPPRSPDGHYWWDGKAWQPIATLPVAPPVRTQAPAPPAPGGGSGEGDWPSWLPHSAQAEAVLEGAAAQEAAPAIPRQPVPAPIAAKAAQPPRPRKPSPLVQLVRLNPGLLPRDPRTLLMVGIGLILVIGIGLTIGALAQAARPSQHPRPAQSSRPQASPTGTLAAQADSFVNRSLGPAVAAALRTQAPIDANCGSYSARCRDSLLASNLELQNVLAIIARGPVPSCVADPTHRVQVATQAIDDGVTLALSGFLGNNQDTIASGLRNTSAGSPGLRSAMDSLSAAAKSSCTG